MTKLFAVLFLMGCGSDYVPCLDSGVPNPIPDMTVADLHVPDLAKPHDLDVAKDMTVRHDMEKPRDLTVVHDLSEPKDMAQCPLCTAAECVADVLACTTQAEKDKLKACHAADDDAKGQQHSFCHKTTPICRCQ